MKKLYSQLAMLLVFSLIFGSIQVCAAELNIESIFSGGYVDAPGEQDIPVYYGHADIDNICTGGAGELPEYYMTEHLPALKSQGRYETCWAFSSTALGEIYALNHTDEFPGVVSADYAEAQLAYFMYNTVPDPLGGTAGDNNSFKGDYNAFNRGGSILYAENVLNTWTGLVSENQVPYSSVSSIISKGLSNEYAYSKDVVHMKGYKNLDLKSNRKEAKALIMENGAIASRIYISRSYYSSLYNSYYYSGNKIVNHAITIVGWDDTFSKDKFSSKPAGDGAWIVKNSYLNSDNASFCYEGYFYLSYYDATLSTAYAFEFENIGRHDTLYQYDGGMITNGVVGDGIVGANAFTAKKTDFGEYIDSVGFYSGGTDSRFVVDIYIDLPEDGSPTSGNHVIGANTTIDTTLQGFYSVSLNKAVYVAPETRFSIVVKSLDNGILGIEGCSESNWVNYYSKVTALPLQSYIVTDGVWNDITKVEEFSGSGNMRIKAYGKDAKSVHNAYNETESGSEEYNSEDGKDVKVDDGDNNSSVNNSTAVSPENSSSDNNSTENNNSAEAAEDVVTIVKNNLSALDNGYFVEYECGADISKIDNLPVVTEYVPYKGMKAIKLPKLKREGYTFKGWYMNGKRVSKITKKMCGNLKLYAKWQENIYTIKYKRGVKGATRGVKGNMSAVRNIPYSRLISLDKCSYYREGYYFAGWSVDKRSAVTVYKDEETVSSLNAKNKAAVSLYAIWRQKQ